MLVCLSYSNTNELASCFLNPPMTTKGKETFLMPLSTQQMKYNNISHVNNELVQPKQSNIIIIIIIIQYLYSALKFCKGYRGAGGFRLRLSKQVCFEVFLKVCIDRQTSISWPLFQENQGKRGVPLCRKLWLKSAWKKHGYIKVTGSTMPIIVIEIMTDFSERAVLLLKNSDWNQQKSIIEWTRLFQCNRFHCAENRHSPKRFFGKWPRVININF